MSQASDDTAVGNLDVSYERPLVPRGQRFFMAAIFPPHPRVVQLTVRSLVKDGGFVTTRLVHLPLS